MEIKINTSRPKLKKGRFNYDKPRLWAGETEVFSGEFKV
jgi:hypothetical protein